MGSVHVLPVLTVQTARRIRAGQPRVRDLLRPGCYIPCIREQQH